MNTNEKKGVSTTTLCVIRHGETDWNLQGRLQGREDIELNDLGREQAVQIARYFEKEQWDVIVSSPLKRAFETAQIIGSWLSIPEIFIIEDITERSYGSASGLLPEERRNLFPDGIPDQEDFEHLRQRAMAGLNKIAYNFSGKRIIVVSHGGLINSILYSLSGGEYGSYKTRLKNGCLNKLTLQDQKWSVDFYNKIAEDFLSPLENQIKLYTKSDIHTMRISEDSRLPGKNRVEEIKNYARKSGIKRIGIANCIGLQKEANKLVHFLEKDFEVFAVDCKIGKIPSAELLNNNLSKGLSCNPAGQADFLDQNHTELNILFGLCIGHDIVFNQKSKAPVTTLIVKDREHKHNPYKEFDDNL